MSYPQYPSSPASTPPILPATNSNNASTSTQNSAARVDLITHRIFVKLVDVVVDARTSSTTSHSSQSPSPYETDDGLSASPAPARTGAKTAVANSKGDRSNAQSAKGEKWFNLEVPESDRFRQQLNIYKSLRTLVPAKVPPLQVSVLLVVPPLNTQPSQPRHGPNVAPVLVHHFTASRIGGASGSADDGASRTRVTRVTPIPSFILLETHTLSFAGDQSLNEDSVELSQVYKQCISLFRSLYTLLRILPTWKAQRRLRRNRGNSSSGHLTVDIQVSVGAPLETDNEIVAGFDGPRSQPAGSLASESIAFPPITNPLGSFAIRTIYRTHPHYSLESLESLLSHHFLAPSSPTSDYHNGGSGQAITSNTQAAAQREPVHFTPTLTSALERQRKESLASSSPRSPLPLPIPERVRPFPLHSDPDHPSSPLGSLPIRTSLPQSPASSAPIAVPLRQAIAGATAAHNRGESSPASSMSSSPRHRRISALGSVSSGIGVDFPAGAAHTANSSVAPSVTATGLGGASASNSSPRFGGLHGREVTELPFAVGLGSGRTSGVMERTRKESLLGASSAERTSSPAGPSQHGRRPSINSIHPFKSGTLSSSPSSASFRGPHGASPSPFVPTPPTNPSVTSLVLTDQIRRGTPTAYTDPVSGRLTTASPIPSPLPTGTFISPDSPERPPPVPLPGSGTTTTHHRYSSSFGNRTRSDVHTSPSSGSGAGTLGGDASSGSAGRYTSSFGGRPGSLASEAPIRRFAALGLDTSPNDDDDLSAFVEALERPTPLRGGNDTPDSEAGPVDFPAYSAGPSPISTTARPSRLSEQHQPPSRTSTLATVRARRITTNSNGGLLGVSSAGVSAVGGGAGVADATSPTTFRSRAEMDETLRRMTDSFSAGLGSLEGGLRSRRLRSQSAVSAASTSGTVRGPPAALARGERASPVPEERVSPPSGSSGESGSPSPLEDSENGGLGLIGAGPSTRRTPYRHHTPTSNMSSSSLFAGGKRSYDSGEQIVGKMDFGDEVVDTRSPLGLRGRSSDTARATSDAPQGLVGGSRVGGPPPLPRLKLTQQREGDFDAARQRAALHPRTPVNDY